MSHNSVYMMGGISRSSKVILIRFWAWLDNCFQLDNNSFHCLSLKLCKRRNKKQLSKKLWVILSFGNPALRNHLDSNLNWIIFDFWQMIISHSGLRWSWGSGTRSEASLVQSWCPRILCKDLSFLSADNQSMTRPRVQSLSGCHGHGTLHDDHGDHVTTILSLKSLMSSKQPPATRSREKLFC